jgi:hypothetical protein
MNILHHLKWDTKGEKDFVDLTRTAFAVRDIVLHGQTVQTTPAKLGVLLLDPEGPTTEFQLLLQDVMHTLLRLVSQEDGRYDAAFRGKVAPVELVMIAVLIGRTMGYTPDRQLADAIAGLRAYVRANTPKGHVKYVLPHIFV